MASSAHQRTITAAVLTLMILSLLTSCGAGEKSSIPVAAVPPSNTGQILGASPQAAPPSAAQQAPASGSERLGCGTYCQSAGGYGAPGDEGVEAVTILSSGSIPLEPDGYFPLTLTCNLPVPCTGGILACLDGPPELTSMPLGCGRTEEQVDPGATRTLGIPLPTPALGVLHAMGPANLRIIVDNSGVPECEKIPQLAAQCAAIPPTPNGMRPEGIVRLIGADVTVAPPVSGWGSRSPGDEAASHQQLQQLAAADHPLIADQLADRWVPQLSSKRPGTIDDGFTWDDTLTLQEHQRLRDRYGSKLVWSGDWTSFDDKDLWVTIVPITFQNADGALEWCSDEGLSANYCAAKLVSTTRPPAGTFAHQ